MSASSAARRGSLLLALTAGAFALAACSQEAAAPAAVEPEAPAEAPAAAPVAAAPQSAVDYAAALAPRALIIESLGCYRAIHFANVELVRERLSPAMSESLANTPKTRLLTLTTTAMRLDIPGAEQQAAHNAGRLAPLRSEPIPADYEDYLRRCQAVLARAVTLDVG